MNSAIIRSGHLPMVARGYSPPRVRSSGATHARTEANVLHGRRLQGLPWQWGPSTGLEALGHAGEMTRRASRAVETEASPEMLYLWICQLRRAP